MKLRLTTLLSALVMAMMAVFFVAQVSSAQEATEEPVRETASVYKRIPFDCVVPSYGTDTCEGSFRVPDDHTVRVNYTNGPYGADFILRYSSSGDYIDQIGLSPGTAGNLWRNKTGFAKNVYIKVGALNNSRYRVRGTFLVLN